MARRPDWLMAQLPVGMLDDDLFRRFMAIFQDVGTSILDTVDSIENTVDTHVAPDTMVRYLGSWIGLHAIDPSLPVELQRAAVLGYSQVLAWRGTRRGLAAFLALLCGTTAEIDDSGGVWREGEAPRHSPSVAIRVPSTGWVSEEDFVELVLDELPANVLCTITVDDRRVWPTTSEGAAA